VTWPNNETQPTTGRLQFSSSFFRVRRIDIVRIKGAVPYIYSQVDKVCFIEVVFFLIKDFGQYIRNYHFKFPDWLIAFDLALSILRDVKMFMWRCNQVVDMNLFLNCAIFHNI
jgi:hypothetical protein